MLSISTLLSLSFFWGACQKECTSVVDTSGQSIEHPIKQSETNVVTDRSNEDGLCDGTIRLFTGMQVGFQYSHYYVVIESQACHDSPWVFEYSFDETTLNSLGNPVPIKVKHDNKYRITVANLTDWNIISFQSTIESQNTIRTPVFTALKGGIIPDRAIYGLNTNPEIPARSDCGYGWISSCTSIPIK